MTEATVGLDLGTGGARAVAMDFCGHMLAQARCKLPSTATVVSEARVQQDPHAWTDVALGALRDLSDALPSQCQVTGIAVDATSGTFLLADGDHKPLSPGIMYNDLRASDGADEVAQAMRPCLAPYGIDIAPSFALPKILHLLRSDPDRYASCRHVVHQTEWISGMLSGRYDVTDISTALKTGADPARLEWPTAIDQLGISRDWLPKIVLPGTQIGELTTAAAAATGLPAGVSVVAGCTDGTAGCLASGAKSTGDLNVTLGTTLVFKAIADRPLVDPEGAVYNHRHPAGGFLPGAASSTGGEWVDEYLLDADLEQLGAAAELRLPTGRCVYPLVKAGERFPFASAEAVGFGLDEISPLDEKFAAGMEGTALLERMSIDRLEQLGLRIGHRVYATGGGVAGDTWLKIRAAANRRTYTVPRYPECAVGAAVLAASPRLGGCSEAISSIVREGQSVEPDERLADAYDAQYERFEDALRERGYR